jgi:uncharacterized protein YuzB (UPF0349 family)
VYSDEHCSASGSKLCQNQLNTNPDVDSINQYHNTDNVFTPVGSRTSNSWETDLSYCNSLSDYSTQQGFGELDRLDDFDIVEYMNSSDLNSG